MPTAAAPGHAPEPATLDEQLAQLAPGDRERVVDLARRLARR